MNVIVIPREGNTTEDYAEWEKEINEASDQRKDSGDVIQTIIFRDDFAIVGYHRHGEIAAAKSIQGMEIQDVLKEVTKKFGLRADD